MNNSYYKGEYSDRGDNKYGYYQNMCDMFGGYNPIVERQSAGLRKLGMKIGAALLCFTLLQYVVSFFLALTGLVDTIYNDSVIYWSTCVISQAIYVLLPFAVLYFSLGNDKHRVAVAFEKPKKTKPFILAVLSGLMICLVGDFISSYVSAFFNFFGTDFYQQETPVPDNAFGYIVFAVGCAVMPALVEEFAFRGILLTSLRKYGDKFAIVCSALLFAIMHGNMVQIPFAFIAGLALGYFMVTTGSIRTSVLIHFLNNFIATIFSVYYNVNPQASNLLYYVLTSVIIIVGIAAMILWIISCRKKLEPCRLEITTRTSYDVFLCTPTIVACFFIAISSSFSQSEFTSGIGMFTLIAAIVLITVVPMRMIGRIAHDSRIKYSSVYTVSKVLIVASDIFLVFEILFSGLNLIG